MWLNLRVFNPEVLDDNFTVFRKNRDSGSGRQKGGGYLLAVRNW